LIKKRHLNYFFEKLFRQMAKIRKRKKTLPLQLGPVIFFGDEFSPFFKKYIFAEILRFLKIKLPNKEKNLLILKNRHNCL
jgi:hypothetical protein